MQYVFAIFVFGSMISLLVLKGVMMAQDLTNEKLKEQSLEETTKGTGGDNQA